MKKMNPKYKLDKSGSVLVNKNGNRNSKFWSYMKPTFSFMFVTVWDFKMKGDQEVSVPSRGVFKCRQTGQLIDLKIKW